MHKLVLLASTLAGLVTGSAAILVGADGSGVISFDSKPPAHAWATRSVPGTELSFANVGALDAAVQTNSVAIITNELVDALGSVPAGQNALASWTSGGAGAVWTRPTANGATLLLATLLNNTGTNQTVLRLSYTLTQSGATPAEQVPGHQAYYSFTGAAGTWVNIAALSGGSTGFKSNVVTLAGTWNHGDVLHLLWVDDNTTGGVDRGYAIDDVFFSGKPAPDVQSISNRVVDVLQLVREQVTASSFLPGGQLTYSLAGAPSLARINPTNGLFLWVPSRADAGTTNVISIRVTDAAAPETSATVTFAVTVNHYVELSVGSTVLLAGEDTNVVITSVASAPVTNVSFLIRVPRERLTNVVVDNLISSDAELMFGFSPSGILAFSFTALPGSSISGTQQLARVNFTAVADQSSAFVPLRTEAAFATRLSDGLPSRVLLGEGRIAVIGAEPLLEATIASGEKLLTLYGNPGTLFGIQSATNVLGPWQTLISGGVLSSRVNSFGVTEHAAGITAVFYRAFYGTGEPPALAAFANSAEGSIGKTAVKALKRIKAKKKKLAALKAARRTAHYAPHPSIHP